MQLVSKRAWLVVAAALASSWWLLSFVPTEAVFWSPDEGGRYLDLRQILKTHQFRNPIPYPGSEIDPEIRFVPLMYYLERGGILYSWWPSTFPALSSLPYAIFGVRGLFLLPIACSLLVSWVASRSSRSHPGLAFACCAFATPLAFYAFTFWEHSLAALAVTLAFVAVTFAWSRNRHSFWLFAGALFALATHLRIESSIALGAAVAASLFRLRFGWPLGKRALSGVLLMLAAYAAIVAPLAISWDGEPSALDLHYRMGRRLRETPRRLVRWETASPVEVLMGARAQGGIDLGPPWKASGLVAGLACFLAPWWVRKRSVWIVGVAGAILLAASVRALAMPAPYVSVHGWMLVAPYLALVGWSLAAPERSDPSDWGALSFSGLLIFLLTSFVFGWEAQGGLQWGPRYALIMTPAVVIATFQGLERMESDQRLSGRSRPLLACVFFGLYLAGFGFQVRGLHQLVFAKRTFASWQATLEALPKDALLVTDSPTLAQCLPEVYERRVLLRMDEVGSLPRESSERARASGFGRVCALTGFEKGSLSVGCRPLDP